mgnify:CR=1 FL=1
MRACVHEHEPGREAGGVTQNERLPRLAGIEKRQRPSHAQQRRPPHRRLAGPHAREPLRQLVTRIRGDEWSAKGLMRGPAPTEGDGGGPYEAAQGGSSEELQAAATAASRHV